MTNEQCRNLAFLNQEAKTFFEKTVYLPELVKQINNTVAGICNEHYKLPLEAQSLLDLSTFLITIYEGQKQVGFIDMESELFENDKHQHNEE